MNPKRPRKDIIRLVKAQVRKLSAYHVDESQVDIKLDAMENPFPPAGALRKEVIRSVSGLPINLYPDPSAKLLKKAIGSYWKLNPGQMLLGNGSDELIQTLILAFGGPVLIPVPTFAMYEITARALDQDVVTVPLDTHFALDADAVIRTAHKAKARIIFLACPNNPTGNRFSDLAIRNILNRTGAAVVLDEAYYSFSGRTCLPLLPRYPNLIILRTLSKIGFAGLRLGVLIGSEGIVAELNKIRLPYNINSLSQAVGAAALKHSRIIEAQISLLISERETLYNALSRTAGVTAYPSETNFILFRTDADAGRVHEKLKQASILIKNLSKPGPLRNCLRVTVGRPEENRKFLKRLKQILMTV